jgi:hypothetical protein
VRDCIAFLYKTMCDNHTTIRMEIAGHPDLEILEFKKFFALYFFELLRVVNLPLICQPLYYSQNFFSIEFNEVIQKFFSRAPAVGGESEFHGKKIPLDNTSRFGMICSLHKHKHLSRKNQAAIGKLSQVSSTHALPARLDIFGETG